MRLPVTFGAILALALVGGCGGGSASPTSPGPSAAGPTPTNAALSIVCNASGSGTAVAIANFAFNPASANVAANGFVTWNNSDSTTHTVTFDNGPDCGSVSGGGTTTAQFAAAGSYAYHCRIHPSMKGTIVVG
ncbi:MAG: cupredoxin domain-containing protein [Chloroflexota bacterium]|nr:cupredoxin domain-containing protein [Chloroflexota bacterium]